MNNLEMSFVEVVKYLEALGIMPKTKPGLEKIKGALIETSWFKKIDPKKVIVVAGTNGKGSTCAILESLLQHAGCRVGFYSSPHLVKTTERIRVNGSDISEEVFCQVFFKNKELIERHQLSHFESLTLMAGDIFFSEEFVSSLDFIIFEVGLGGTFDATNAFPHHWNVITKLGMDHVDILGPTLQDIARNKFGIIGTESVVVHAPFEKSIQTVAEEIQNRTRSRWVQAEKCRSRSRVTSELDQKDHFSTHLSHHPSVTLSDFVAQSLHENFLSPWGEVQLSLPGQRGIENAMLALTLFSEMGFQPKAHLSALTKVRWSGRMQYLNIQLNQSKRLMPVFVSGDHNEQGVNSLCEILQERVVSHSRVRKLHMIVGIGKDKDAENMLRQLADLPHSVMYLTETPFKGRSIQDYPEWIKTKALFADEQVGSVLEFVCESMNHEQDIVLVTGSLYLVGEVLKLQL